MEEPEQKVTGAVMSADVSGPASEERTVTVHICGEVNQPGVYEVPEGSRYYEVLALAGGVTGTGAGDYLNLATVVRDGEKIVVPSLSEAGTDPFGSGPGFHPWKGRVCGFGAERRRQTRKHQYGGFGSFADPAWHRAGKSGRGDPIP